MAGAPGAIVTVVELRVKNGPLLPWGAILELSVMVPVNPLVLLMVIAVMLELPCRTSRLEGLAEIVKSGGSLLAHWTLVSADVSVAVAFDTKTDTNGIPTVSVRPVSVAFVFVAVKLAEPTRLQPGLISPLASSLATETPPGEGGEPKAIEAKGEPAATIPPSEVF